MLGCSPTTGDLVAARSPLCHLAASSLEPPSSTNCLEAGYRVRPDDRSSGHPLLHPRVEALTRPTASRSASTTAYPDFAEAALPILEASQEFLRRFFAHGHERSFTALRWRHPGKQRCSPPAQLRRARSTGASRSQAHGDRAHVDLTRPGRRSTRDASYGRSAANGSSKHMDGATRALPRLSVRTPSMARVVAGRRVAEVCGSAFTTQARARFRRRQPSARDPPRRRLLSSTSRACMRRPPERGRRRRLRSRVRRRRCADLRGSEPRRPSAPTGFRPSGARSPRANARLADQDELTCPSNPIQRAARHAQPVGCEPAAWTDGRHASVPDLLHQLDLQPEMRATASCGSRLNQNATT